MKKEKLSFKEKINLFKRVFTDIHRISPGFLAARLAIQFFNAAEQFIPIYLSGVIVDGISGEKSLNEIIILIIIFLAAGFLLQSSGQCFQKLLYAKINRLKYYTDIMISEKIVNMDYAKTEDSSVQRENDKVFQFNNMFGDSLLFTAADELSIVFYGIVTSIFALIATADLYGSIQASDSNNLWLINLSVPIIIVFNVVLLIIENINQSKRIKKQEEFFYSDEYAAPQRVMNNFLYDYAGSYQTGKDIHLYNQKVFILRRVKELWEKIYSGWRRMDNYSMRVGLLNTFLRLARTVSIYAFAGFRAIVGSVSAGGLIKDVQSFNKLWWGINRFTSALAFLNSLVFPFKTLYGFLDIPNEKYMGTIPTEKRDDNEYEFEFKHVWFRYPGSEQFVLKDINLKWKIGEKMALVGRNGCGKSTLVKLLCRFYDPSEGEITLNGINIKKYDYNDYMALFSVVFQDSRLFSFSIAENVAAGNDYDEERVKDCIVRAGMGDRINEMEKGTDTCLYKEFDENGVEISGGEAQKLCLARAVYKGAPFIVLDEPTAALDPVSEYDIYNKFNSIVGTRTAVYISHRLSSCKFCDEITVMDDGSIKERGTHDELMEKNGIYAALWKAQAEYYKDTAESLFA